MNHKVCTSNVVTHNQKATMIAYKMCNTSFAYDTWTGLDLSIFRHLWYLLIHNAQFQSNLPPIIRLVGRCGIDLLFKSHSDVLNFGQILRHWYWQMLLQNLRYLIDHPGARLGPELGAPVASGGAGRVQVYAAAAGRVGSLDGTPVGVHGAPGTLDWRFVPLWAVEARGYTVTGVGAGDDS